MLYLDYFRRQFSRSLGVLLYALAGSSAVAHEDHPLLSGLPGFELMTKDVKSFDQIVIQTADVVQTPEQKYSGPLTFEGKMTRMAYNNAGSAGPKPSQLEIYRNYAAAIKGVGGLQLNNPSPSQLRENANGWNIFQVARAGGSPATALLRIPYPHRYELVIVEPQAMVQAVQAGELARQIKSGGFATLYINFDTNKAELKEDGTAAVTQIAQLMRDDKTLRISIEGHTDNVGKAAANLVLSRSRAEAVMKAVVAQGIDAKRLAALGHGQEIPIADNRNEEGRAKNRRVELVRLKP